MTEMHRMDNYRSYSPARPRMGSGPGGAGLTRPRHGRMISGVAAGIAERLGVDPALVRVAFVVSTLFSGVGLIAYLVMWAVVPEQDTLEDLLAARLELGEITADEYRQMLADMDTERGRRRRR